MKNIIITVLTILMALFVWFWVDQKKNAEALAIQLNALKDSLSFTSNILETSTSDFDLLKREKDSLYTLLQSNNARGNAKPQYTPEERAVHQLIIDVHNGWEDVFKSKKTEPFLNLFMPKYTTNEVTIDTKNIPHVERHNDKDFKEHVLALANTSDLSIDFENTKFINTFVKDNIFTVTYQTKLNVKEKYKTVQASDIICYMSGEKSEGKWKVGNYNWTRYDGLEYQY